MSHSPHGSELVVAQQLLLLLLGHSSAACQHRLHGHPAAAQMHLQGILVGSTAQVQD